MGLETLSPAPPPRAVNAGAPRGMQERMFSMLAALDLTQDKDLQGGGHPLTS